MEYYFYFSKNELIIVIICTICVIGYFLMKKIKSHYNDTPAMPEHNNSNLNTKENSDIEKGKVGEQRIVEELEKIDIYHKIIRNVYIKNNDKKTEIDIIYITTCGIFIIESKNFNGIVYGHDNNSKWFAKYRNKKDPYEFDNPILQNNYHIDFLCKKLNLDKEEYFKSYIVFGNNTYLKFIKLTKYFHTKVINTQNIIENIINDIHNSPITLSHEEIDKIFIDLQFYCEHMNR